MAVFTQADFLAGKCKHIEVGTEAEPRWSTQDAAIGICTADAVGTRREVLPNTGVDLNVNEVVQQALNQIGAAQLSGYLAGRPDIIAPLVVKLGLNNITKDQTVLPNLDDITEEDIATLSSDDLKRILLKAAGITKKSELDALKD